MTMPTPESQADGLVTVTPLSPGGPQFVQLKGEMEIVSFGSRWTAGHSAPRSGVMWRTTPSPSPAMRPSREGFMCHASIWRGWKGRL
jgi:hypothetical protein